MTTALDIITSALQNLGAIAIDEAPTAGEAAQGLSALNAMLDTWSTESLSVYTTQPEVFPLTAGINSYTMGTGGDFNTTRPIQIDQIKIRNPSGYDYPTDLLTDGEYAAIYIKTLQGTYPLAVYDDGNFPLKTLYFYPVPVTSGYSAVIWSWQRLASFANLTTAFSFPPGYQEAMEFNLPGRLSGKYGRVVPDSVKELAVSTKAQIKTKNVAIEEMTIDARLTGGTGSRPTLAAFSKGPFV